jgi:hypothetical protein
MRNDDGIGFVGPRYPSVARLDELDASYVETQAMTAIPEMAGGLRRSQFGGSD